MYQKIKLQTVLSGFTLYLVVLPLFGQTGLSQGQIDRMLSVVEAIYSEQQLVGMQVAVFSGGTIAAEINLGYADLEHNVRVTNDTRFEVASVNKTFTGLGVLMLEEAGNINLDAPIRQYVPEFPEKPEGTITPRLLAGALGGIRHYEEGERTPAYYAAHYEDVVEALELFKNDPLVVSPGAQEFYSSYGYVLLAAAMQRASKVSYQQYIQKALIDPLGLENTGFIDVRIPMENRSRHYSFIDPYTREVTDQLRVLPTMEHSSNTGAGNMYSNAIDLATFGGQFIRPGFISAKVYEQIYQPHYTADGTATQFSDGWILFGIDLTPRFLFFGGSYPGATAFLSVYPDSETAVAIVTNTWGKSGSDWTLPILNTFAEIILTP